MEHGVVRSFNQVSEYGLIACVPGGRDRYVRRENVAGAPPVLCAGTQVAFEPREGGLGPEAINVRPLEEISGNS